MNLNDSPHGLTIFLLRSSWPITFVHITHSLWRAKADSDHNRSWRTANFISHTFTLLSISQVSLKPHCARYIGIKKKLCWRNSSRLGDFFSQKMRSSMTDMTTELNAERSVVKATISEWESTGFCDPLKVGGERVETQNWLWSQNSN